MQEQQLKYEKFQNKNIGGYEKLYPKPSEKY